MNNLILSSQEAYHPINTLLRSYTTENSVRAALSSLNTIASIVSGGDLSAYDIEWQQIDLDAALEIRRILAEHYKTSSANRHLSVLRKLIKTYWEKQLIDTDAYMRISNIPGIRGNELAPGRELASSEIAQLLKCCVVDRSPSGARDAAIIAVLCAGLRRAEVVMLNIEDYHENTGRIDIHDSKGGKSRTAYLPRNGTRYMDNWLAVRGRDTGPIFPHVRHSVINIKKRLTEDGLRYIVLNKRGTESGISNFSLHDFRRTFAGNMLNAGVDIATVAKLMGHSDIKTTGKYDRRTEQTKADAAQHLSIPLVV